MLPHRLIQKHEDVFKRLETIVGKAHSLSGGTEVLMQTDEDLQASTTNQATFDKALGKSKLMGQLKTDVGKVQTQVSTINTSMAGIKSEQKSGFGKIEALMRNLASSESSSARSTPAFPIAAASSPVTVKTPETPPMGSDPSCTLDEKTTEDNMVDSNIHDELVRLLELSSANTVVVRARPADGASISLARWLNKILASKRVSNWQETLITMGHAEPVVKSLDDIDAIFDFLYGHIQSNSQGAKVSLDEP